MTTTITTTLRTTKAQLDKATAAGQKLLEAGRLLQDIDTQVGLALTPILAYVHTLESKLRTEVTRLTVAITAPPQHVPQAPVAAPAPAAAQVTTPTVATQPNADAVLKLYSQGKKKLQALAAQHNVTIDPTWTVKRLAVELATKLATMPAAAPVAKPTPAPKAVAQTVVATPKPKAQALVPQAIDTMDRHTMLTVMAQFSDEQLRTLLGCMAEADVAKAIRMTCRNS